MGKFCLETFLAEELHGGRWNEVALCWEKLSRKTVTGVGKSIRSEKENEHISLGTITFREGLEQVKGEGGLDPDFALSSFVS